MTAIARYAGSSPVINTSATASGKRNSTVPDTSEIAPLAPKQYFSMARTRLGRPAPQLYPTAGCSASHMPYSSGRIRPSAYIRIP